ncbi:hypothetical protein CBM2623_B30097 [Cupriavidus taiwanensis]|nr:hypothetical protein CBM2623_B30097 [Cupriavidus taiwanensis]
MGGWHFELMARLTDYQILNKKVILRAQRYGLVSFFLYFFDKIVVAAVEMDKIRQPAPQIAHFRSRQICPAGPVIVQVSHDDHAFQHVCRTGLGISENLVNFLQAHRAALSLKKFQNLEGTHC